MWCTEHGISITNIWSINRHDEQYMKRACDQIKWSLDLHRESIISTSRNNKMYMKRAWDIHERRIKYT